MIKLSASDLSYLLAQVNIGNDYSQLASPIDPNGVREVSGSNNNLVGGFEVDPVTGNLVWTGGYDAQTGLVSGNNANSDWGQADTDFLRLFMTNHPDSAADPTLAYGVTYETVKQTATVDANGVDPFDGGSFDPTGWIPTFTPDVMGSIIITGEGMPGGTSPRTITQLITSSDVDPASPTYNPAAAAAMEAFGGQPVDVANSVVGSAQTAFIPNPGILGGVTYNEFFVAFGQFFDHGLDFISKGGGYVLIPLSPNDPLYDPVSNGNPMQNMMMLSRASLSNPAGDFAVDAMGNATLKIGVTPQFNNNTGLMIDQSQTYGSHEAHNVLVRQYDSAGNLTGRLIDGSEDGLINRIDPLTGKQVQIDLLNHTATVLDAMLMPTGAVTMLAVDADGAVEWPAGSGRYLDGRDELASWADMQANAARIGVELSDADVLDIPRIKADAIGRLITQDVYDELHAHNIAEGLASLDPSVMFTPQSAVLYRSDETLDEMATRLGGTAADYEAGDPFFRDASGNVLMSNQPLLADIAHSADPSGGPGTYSAELLALHKVSGDGRVNENIGLTSVHHVFHEEHNIQANQVMVQSLLNALQSDDVSKLNVSNNGWLEEDIDTADLAQIRLDTGFGAVDLTDPTAVSAYLESTAFEAAVAALNWDGEKIYQAARIVTESEYNHIAVDQYMGGLYPALPEFVSYSADINLNVSLEFSQAVFRLGHSQLLEQMQIATPNDTGNPGDPGYIPTSFTQEDLFNVFLNPSAYDQYGAPGIISGLLNQQGNEMDEFVTAALQQSLVGIPLDLPALNIARGRDVGLPTLNELRQQAFDGLMQNTSNNSNGSGIAPYTSWADFGGSMRNPDSLVNFIAAYARDDLAGHDWGINEARAAYEAGTGSLQDIRAAAQAMLDAHDAGNADAVQFMQGGGKPVYTGDPSQGVNGWVYTGGSGDLGFWDIDLWIGGLAEQPLFDGPLGTTFSLVLLDFAQRMQDGDRFYYLYRMPVGQHLGDQIIGEQFADLVMRTTGLEHVGDAFGYQSAYYYLDSGADGDANGKTDVDADDDINDYFNAIYESLPAVTKNLVVANKSFEVQDLVADGGTTNTNGTYINGNPLGWTIAGSGGTWAPDTETALDPAFVVNPNGMSGSKVAYLNNGAVLSQLMAAALVEGATYAMTVSLGNREDWPGARALVELVAADGTVLGSTEAQVDTDGWHDVSISTDGMSGYGPIDAGLAGQAFSIRITNLGATTVSDGDSGTLQLLVDNVRVSVTEPGGSANDGHIVVVGGTGNDFIKAALGDDYVYGDEGDDVIEGAQGNDHLYGGDGNDWITDYENDDFIHGGAGNDYISAGPGVLDTVHGGDGDDEVHGGDGIDEVFGDDGDDILYGEGDTDLMEGGDGNDFMDGGDSVDEMFAGNGNDWLRGGVGDDHMNGGSGNDLMEGGGGPVANDGDRYFGDQAAAALPLIEFNGDGTIGNMDIASYENMQTGVTASLQTLNATGTNSNLLDSYAFVDGIVGSAKGDNLEGGGLDATGSNGWNNQLIGGGGSDRLKGLGDDAGVVTNSDVDTDPYHYVDWIFGDAVVVRNDLWVDLAATQYYNSHGETDNANYTFLAEWGGKDIGIAASKSTTGETRVVFSDTGELGHILGEDGVGANDIDTAVYRADISNYNITGADNGVVTISDTRPVPADPQTGSYDGIDKLLGIEKLEFNGVEYNLVIGTGGNDRGVQGAGHLRGDQGNAVGVNTMDIILGLGGNDTLIGYSLDDYLVGGAGNDVVNGAAGNDTIIWNNGDGSDIVNGGGGGQDTFVVNDNGMGGDFQIFAVDSAGNATNRASIETAHGTLNLNTDIVIVRNGALIAQLFNVEELIVNAVNVSANDGNGIPNPGINVSVLGDFSTTALNYSTITINGDDGDDMVDISGLLSDHRIVFHGAGGNNHLIGNLRPQDTVDNADVNAAPVGPGNGGDEDDDETHNHAPVLSGPVILQSIGMNTPMALTAAMLLANTTDPDGDMLQISNLSASSGTVFQEPDGSWSFTPDDDDSSDVVFSYQIGDGSVAIAQTATLDLIAPPSSGPSGGAWAQAGTSAADVMIGDDGEDVLSGGGGDDVILGNGGDDTLVGGSGDDLIKGGAGKDVVFGGSGNDDLFGGTGQDMLFGDGGNDRIFADEGDDVIEGGAGSDTVYAGSGDDRVIANVGDGDDVYWGEAGRDTLDYAAITEDLVVDLGNGLLQHGSVVSSQSGHDAVFGFENVIGGSGHDTIIASAAVNVMDGGAGNDSFVFGSAQDADGDTIVGFQPGDKIDLSGIDADSGMAGQQSFVLFAGTGFTAAGQVMVTHSADADGEHTLVSADTDGNGSADFEIDVAGTHNLAASDFNFG
ncbi:MAG TPA: hypothetical protein ENH55_12995 [Aurantimonas coralicida]|uniref:Cadherin-like domain-containing protein n=2 Tax=root TaxID=1 RepID=A0A9C9TGU0_9HYPH|nr:hypothetical protein [Aurantimonas coralicida]HEU00810.1 hypothetical protein [Aurantimonas coralicida]